MHTCVCRGSAAPLCGPVQLLDPLLRGRGTYGSPGNFIRVYFRALFGLGGSGLVLLEVT